MRVMDHECSMLYLITAQHLFHCDHCGNATIARQSIILSEAPLGLEEVARRDELVVALVSCNASLRVDGPGVDHLAEEGGGELIALLEDWHAEARR
jgi:hypothetical protein